MKFTPSVLEIIPLPNLTDLFKAIDPLNLNSAHEILTLSIDITQAGSIYVDVYFDNLKINHYRNKVITQTTDYYPGGSVLRTAKTNEENHYRYGYQGEFSEEDEETGWNSFELRMYDPIIGRWMAPDPYRHIGVLMWLWEITQ